MLRHTQFSFLVLDILYYNSSCPAQLCLSYGFRIVNQTSIQKVTTNLFEALYNKMWFTV